MMIKFDAYLQKKITPIFETFDFLATLNKKYSLAFSGGKDSHCLLGLYLYWTKHFHKHLDLQVIFNDTLLEHDSLYKIIKNVHSFLNAQHIHFKITYPKKSYWYYQFAIGYPVPHHFNRWCTNDLKIRPAKDADRIIITGRHKGESKSRDARLGTCGSEECGIDKIKDSYDPLIDLSNCDVWDIIFYLDNIFLPANTFNSLKRLYAQNTNTKGSLRMGCIMCPVVAINTLRQSSTDNQVAIRLVLEKLRNARRILNPRSKKQGAIYIPDRAKIWEEIKPLLINEHLISEIEIAEIDLAIANHTYPKTYTSDWIKEQELLIEHAEPINNPQLELIFN